MKNSTEGFDSRPQFIADENVGKLARLLRLLGYDTLFFKGSTDDRLVDIALAENRIILTRDTHIPQRSPISRGKIRAVLIRDDKPAKQLRQVIGSFSSQERPQPFTLCLECNRPLRRLTLEEARNRVPPYVWQTQKEYVECPQCGRVYWKGTHWQAMSARLTEIVELNEDKNEFPTRL
jgi:uncharacterized protein